MFHLFKLLFIFWCCILLGSNAAHFSSRKRDISDCGDGSKAGNCKLVTDCPYALRLIKERKNHGLERCGFEGFIEIVCCPLKEPIPGKPTAREPIVTVLPKSTRKSEAACDEYLVDLPPNPTLQILGGDNATLGEFPHMAALGYELEENDEISWECGGSLISNRFVLSAAHCIVKQDGILPTRVRLGIIDLLGRDRIKPADFNVANIIVHPEYQPRTKLNDIALIELEGKTPNNQNVFPACLYQKNDNPIGLVITGWGHTSQGGEPSDILQKAQLLPVTVPECSLFYETRLSRSILNSQICAISDDGTKDTCQGDSGGPLQVQEETSSIYTVVGVTSYGLGCGGKNPGIYTRVYSYLDWIESYVWP